MKISKRASYEDISDLTDMSDLTEEEIVEMQKEWRIPEIEIPTLGDLVEKDTPPGGTAAYSDWYETEKPEIKEMMDEPVIEENPDVDIEEFYADDAEELTDEDILSLHATISDYHGKKIDAKEFSKALQEIIEKLEG